MKLDLKGAILSVRIGKDNGLLPLHEAITNSIQAIEDSGKTPGEITVEITREDVLDGLEGDSREIAPIKDVSIIDTGVGFNQANFDSFCTGHSTYKLERGGKGLGRFSWLKVFERAEIKSHFFEGKRIMHRGFVFDLNFVPEEAHSTQKASNADGASTEILLKSMHPDYGRRTVKKFESIADHIIRHHYSAFLREDCPRIVLKDNDKVLVLNDVFKDAIGASESCEPFHVGEQEFRLVTLKYREPPRNLPHRLIFSGIGREVQSEDLSKEISGLPKRLCDQEDQRDFVLLAIVEGDYLDQHIDNERTGFRFPGSSTDQLSLSGEPTLEDIRKTAVSKIKSHLREFLSEQRAATKARLRRLISQRYPRYRPLLSDLDDILDRFDPDDSDTSFELILHQEYQKKTELVRKRGIELVTDSEQIRDPSKLISFARDANEIGKSELATYVAYRRWILSLLRKSFEFVDDSQRYALEEAIHTLICPMRKDSADIQFEDHNLWVIDERLAYHHFLASDKELRGIARDIFESESRLRPDLLVFDTPHVYTDTQTPHSSFVVVEFKRAERNDYKWEGDNPIDQVFDQVEIIRQGKYKGANGRRLRLADQERSPGYAFIICDITEKLKALCHRRNYRPTPDQMGFYYFQSNMNLYIEIISYEKLLMDAERRNQILFDKLQIPLDYFQIDSHELEREVAIRRGREVEVNSDEGHQEQNEGSVA